MSIQGFMSFPQQDDPRTQIFYATHAFGATATWQVWDKPRGAQWVHGVLMASGSGGGGGLTGAASAARGGGGGGGSGGRLMFVAPAFLLPDRLFVSVGKGGLGQGSGVAGGDGQNSFVSPLGGNTNAQVILCRATTGTGGAAGTSSGASAGGAAGSGTAGISLVGGWALCTVIPGDTGGAGGNASGAAGSSKVIGATGPATGGAGGGGTTSADFAGGSQSTSSAVWFPTITGGAAGANNGPHGFWSWGPQFVGGCGGTGGGASNTSVGGLGGNGAFGCGGGGGGGGTTGGAGGRGGDGLVIICVW